jgi:hydroxymethylglutaryl-CoA synthase
VNNILQHNEVGISAIGLTIPTLALPLEELARIHNIDPTRYLDGLGCRIMSLCGPDENVITLAVTAAKRALANWHGNLEQIGLIVVATETAMDMSRPLSSWVMEALGLKSQVRSYEVKHACYGGTVALRQAVEWKLSGNCKGKAALVIAADVAMYASNHSGEPTQGAGAIALIIDEPLIASINPISYYWSDPQFDFWRPVGNKYPEVNGRLSLTCYINAAMQCFMQLAPQEQLAAYLNEFKFINFHVPFPKMVFSAAKRIGDYCGWDATNTLAWYESKILSTMQWNQKIGNSYTASLWFSVAYALTQTQAKEQLAAFSYGSGCGSELLTLQCTNNQATASWVEDLNKDFAQREIIDATMYQKLRNEL